MPTHLTFFPVPYPDETWHSVLSRYHIRSGNIHSAITFRELMQTTDHAPVGGFLPNYTITHIINRLPDGFLDPDEIILKHTLFPYAFRFQDRDTKQRLLETVKTGQLHFPVPMSKEYTDHGLKFCPLCVKSDVTAYGEPYWHLCHQIPCVEICPTHKCRLKSCLAYYRNLPTKKLFLPEQSSQADPDFNLSKAETDLTHALLQYQTLPLEYCPTKNYNQIFTGIQNAGYSGSGQKNKVSLDLDKLSSDLCKAYGEQMITKILGGLTVKYDFIRNFTKWNCKYPEVYALFAAFIHMVDATAYLKSQSQ